MAVIEFSVKTTTDGSLEEIKVPVDTVDGLQDELDKASAHIANTSNPHGVTKAQVGLGNVDNTSDSAKPISTATQTALNAKANSADLATVATSGSYNDLSNKPTIPTVNNGTLTVTQNGTSKGTFTANQSGNTTIALTDTTYSNASTTSAGLMSASDKSKLDGIASGATAVTVDSALSSTSTNPVQNKVINSALSGKQNTLTAGTNVTISGNTISATDTNTTYTFASGDSNGTIKVTPSGGTAQSVAVTGLGSAAYTASTAYATSAQGTKADNAVPNTRKVNGKALSADITLSASDVGALSSSTAYVSSVNGSSGAITNVAKTNASNTFSGNQSVTGNLTVGGNLVVNGTNTTVNSTTLAVADKLIEVASGNTVALTTPAGLVAPKYDGTNSGAMVFDASGTAYVGDVVLDSSGNITVASSALQPLATRSEASALTNGNLLKWDSTNTKLVDSGLSASSVAKTSDIPTVNNGTLTIQKNGTSVATFSANQSGSATANITVPTKVSELTNDSGYTKNTGTITGITMNGASKGTSGVVDLGTLYWANIATSNSSNTNTSPTFSTEFKANIGSNSVLSPAYNKVMSSPIPKYSWHDLFAFGANGTPAVEYSSDGSTWTATTDENLTKKLFISKENQVITVLSDTYQAMRWTWTSTSFHACSAYYLLVGFAYTSPIATYDILFEVSTDNSTWTTGFTKTGVKYNQAPYWFYLNCSWSSVKYARLTLTKTSDTGSLALSGIKLLTSRWGNQGLGSEKEKPYDWDNTPNLLPKVNGTSSLGTSSNKWSAVYATNLYENGTALSSKYLGISAKASDSAKLNGQEASYYLNYNNFTNKPTIPTTYAGSSSAGGSATSAVKLDTTTAGSATQPVYFSGGKPVATTYTLSASVPSGAKFTDTTYSVATTSANGLMSSTDKAKLDGIASGANAYTLPTATSSVLGGVKIGSNITNTSGTISLTKANVTSALGYTPPTSDTDTGATSVAVSGTGNAVTTASYDSSTRKLTLTKGTTFLTSHQSLSNYVTLDGAQTISGVKTFSASNNFTNETKFTNASYAPTFTDIASGLGKSSCFTRGALMQTITGQIIAPNAAVTDTTRAYNTEVGKIKFQRITGTSSGQPTLADMASIDSTGIKEGSSYLKDKYVTLSGDAQTISSKKTFTNNVTIDGSNSTDIVSLIAKNAVLGAQDGVLGMADSVFQVQYNGVNAFNIESSGVSIDDGQTGTVPLKIYGESGTAGQVLTSNGEGITPKWADKFDIVTITDISVALSAEDIEKVQKPDTLIKYYTAIYRYSYRESQTSRYVYYEWINYSQYFQHHTLQIDLSTGALTIYDTSLVTFGGTEPISGEKTFSGGVNLTSNLLLNSSAGESGQVLTSQGSGKTPKWSYGLAHGISASIQGADQAQLTPSRVSGDMHIRIFGGTRDAADAIIIFDEDSTELLVFGKSQGYVSGSYELEIGVNDNHIWARYKDGNGNDVTKQTANTNIFPLWIGGSSDYSANLNFVGTVTYAVGLE